MFVTGLVIQLQGRGGREEMGGRGQKTKYS